MTRQSLFSLQVLVPGEIILGGLFPIHAAGKNGSHCGSLKADQGVQRSDEENDYFEFLVNLIVG